MSHRISHTLNVCRWLVAAFALIFAVSLSANGVVKIIGLTGAVSIHLADGRIVPATDAMILEEHATIETQKGSAATLWFSNGSLATLGESGFLILSRYDQPVPQQFSDLTKRETAPSLTELRLGRGSIVIKARKLHKESSFVVVTNAGETKVHGTEFQVVYDPATQSMSVSTVEGLVAVFPVSGMEQRVGAGQKVNLVASVDEITGLVRSVTVNSVQLTESETAEIRTVITAELQQLVNIGELSVGGETIVGTEGGAETPAQTQSGGGGAFPILEVDTSEVGSVSPI